MSLKGGRVADHRRMIVRLDTHRLQTLRRAHIGHTQPTNNAVRGMHRRSNAAGTFTTGCHARRRGATPQPTRPVQVAIGERRRPQPFGRPGWVRVDTVHQGDLDGIKDLHHRPCFFPRERVDARGRVRKRYRHVHRPVRGVPGGASRTCGFARGGAGRPARGCGRSSPSRPAARTPTAAHEHAARVVRAFHFFRRKYLTRLFRPPGPIRRPERSVPLEPLHPAL